MHSRKVVFSIVLAVLVLHLVSTVVLACDPRVQYCPAIPTYTPPNTGGWNRVQYDVSYGYQVGQQAVQQVQWVGEKVWDSARTYPYGNR